MGFYFKDYYYDAWIHWNVTSVCNFNCEYCFGHITQGKKVFEIDIKRLMSALNATGKVFRISFTGGEPFLVPNIIKAVKAITENHYVSFNTNLITGKIKDFAREIDPARIVRIHASFHIEELKTKENLYRYIGNFQLLEEKGFPLHAEAVAFPRYYNIADEIRQYLLEHEIYLHFGPYLGMFEGKKYPEAYTKKELLKFALPYENRVLFNQSGAFCNAGYNAFVASPKGNLNPCFQFKESSGNIYEKIIFNDSIKVCPHKQCGCPLNVYDERLYLDSLKNIKLI